MDNKITTPAKTTTMADALDKALTASSTPGPATVPAIVAAEVGRTVAPSAEFSATPLNLIDAHDDKDARPDGDGDFDRLFTRVIFVPVSGDIYARERDRRGKASVTVGYSRKVADVQIELAGSGAYTPGTISMVQGINEKNSHLEMSVGVWNPDTRKSSILCATQATKDRFIAWKDKACAKFIKHCEENGIDLAAPVAERSHSNSVGVNLLADVKTAPTA